MTVTGRPELVDEAIDHLLNLEEEYVRCAAPPAYDDCVRHACYVDGLLVMLRHFLVPPLVRWQMLWRMRRRWLT